MSIRASALCVIAALTLVNPAATQDIIGTATVIDGDTLRIGATKIRLYGIDAPEKRQTCRSANGTVWRCGLAAWTRLEALTIDEGIACYRPDGNDGKPLRNDRYGRMIAICGVMAFGQVSRPSLNAQLVEASSSRKDWPSRTGGIRPCSSERRVGHGGNTWACGAASSIRLRSGVGGRNDQIAANSYPCCYP